MIKIFMRSVLLYGAVTWCLSKGNIERHGSYRILDLETNGEDKLDWTRNVTNEEILQRVTV